MTQWVGPQAYVLQLGLGAVPASLGDVRRELGGRLDDLEPRLSWDRDDLRLSLTVAASDLWGAVLTAMAAVTGTGYPVQRLDVRPVTAATRRRVVAD